MITSQFFSLLVPLPFSNMKKSAQTVYTRLLTFYARFILKTHFNIKVRYVNKSNDLFSHPSLLVCNHQSFIDVPLTLSLTPAVRVLNNNWHNNVWAKFFITKYIGFYSIYEDRGKLAKQLKPVVDMGCSLLVFPEGVLYRDQKIGRFHKGGFYLAEKLHLDIQPVVIYYSENILKKKWFFFKNGIAVVKFLDPVKVNTPLYGNTYQELTHNVMTEMRKEYGVIKASVEPHSV